MKSKRIKQIAYRSEGSSTLVDGSRTKPNWRLVVRFQLMALVCVVGLSWAQQPTAIPEPGLLLFGSVRNVAGGLPLLNTAVTWQISGGTPAESGTVPAALIAVNGQFFLMARVPFETRSAGSANVLMMDRETNNSKNSAVEL